MALTVVEGRLSRTRDSESRGVRTGTTVFFLPEVVEDETEDAVDEGRFMVPELMGGRCVTLDRVDDVELFDDTRFRVVGGDNILPTDFEVALETVDTVDAVEVLREAEIAVFAVLKVADPSLIPETLESGLRERRVGANGETVFRKVDA